MAPGSGHEKRIPSLDGLRAISILLVLLSHLGGTRGFPLSATDIIRLGDLGNLGVRVFFVISGYLITRLLLEERARTGSISLVGFYLRRSFRIFPAFLAFVGLIAVASAYGRVHTEPGGFVYALTYTMNFHRAQSNGHALGHLWSLSVEEQFYLLWPAILLLLGNRGGLRAAAAMLLIAPACRYGIYRLWPSHGFLVGTSFPTVADSIATGCLLAGFAPRLEHPGWRRFATSPWFFIVPLAAFAANNLWEHPLVNFVLAHGFMNVAIALTVHRLVCWPEGAVASLLNTRPLAALGTLSYSLYLWQQPFLDRTESTAWCSFPLNLALALLAALLSYRLVERPLLRLRVRWSRPAVTDGIRRAA